jgi:hypothetical protein
MCSRQRIIEFAITWTITFYYVQGFVYVDKSSEFDMFSNYQFPKFPYIINEDDITPLEKLMIEKAMQEISSTTCVEFFPANPFGFVRCPDKQADDGPLRMYYSSELAKRVLCFVKSKRANSTDCHFSYVPSRNVIGHTLYTKMGWIRLDYSPDCFNIRTLMHEILHALGFQHEHQRPDRDNYVRINDTQIINDNTNYGKLNSTSVVYDSPYDVCSIVH